MKLDRDDVILFFGDSITDVDRERSNPESLGQGYPKNVAKHLTQKYPHLNLTFINRGISGDTIKELNQRLEEDCLSHRPDVVSILIGINDVSEYMRRKTHDNIKTFTEDYARILEAVSTAGAQIVLLEPFLLGYPEERQTWRVQLDPLIQAVRRLALQYEAELIPLDGILNAAGIKYDHQTIAGDDGVHPTEKGHRFITDAWVGIIEN